MHLYACLKDKENLKFLAELNQDQVDIKEIPSKELSRLNKRDLLILEDSLLDSLDDEVKASTILLLTDKDLDEKKLLNLKNLEGHLQKRLPSQLNKSIFQKSIEKLSSILNDGLKANLDKALVDSFKELKRVKKLHHQMVPFREEKFKGIKILSKFAAGMASGGEFFDSVQKDRQAILWLSHAKSYVTSSLLFSFFENFSKLNSFEREDIESFLEDMIDELRGLELIDRDQPEILQLMIARIDLTNYTIQGFNFGTTEMVIQNVGGVYSNNLPLNENSFGDAYFERKIQRSEKICLVSPGLQLNSDYMGRKKLLEILNLENRDILDEVFFELKKNTKSDFLQHDSSMILLEVDGNAIMSL